MQRRSYYPANQVLNLRDELTALFYGDESNPGIAQTVLIRRLLDQHCACWYASNGSPNSACQYCQGEGFLFVETLNNVYIARNFGSVLNPASVINRQEFLAQYGLTDENRALCIAEHDCFPNYERYLKPEHPSYDKLYELKVDDDGVLVQPVVRTAKWKMRSVTPHRGDGSQVTYFEVGLEKENL
jgi:hypothetical protein